LLCFCFASYKQVGYHKIMLLAFEQIPVSNIFTKILCVSCRGAGCITLINIAITKSCLPC
jgi:hypothetical protein